MKDLISSGSHHWTRTPSRECVRRSGERQSRLCREQRQPLRSLTKRPYLLYSSPYLPLLSWGSYRSSASYNSTFASDIRFETGKCRKKMNSSNLLKLIFNFKKSFWFFHVFHQKYIHIYLLLLQFLFETSVIWKLYDFYLIKFWKVRVFYIVFVFSNTQFSYWNIRITQVEAVYCDDHAFDVSMHTSITALFWSILAVMINCDKPWLLAVINRCDKYFKFCFKKSLLAIFFSE